VPRTSLYIYVMTSCEKIWLIIFFTTYIEENSTVTNKNSHETKWKHMFCI